jgi:hypothetical protein
MFSYFTLDSVTKEKILKHFFLIGSNVKTMSAGGGHLGWRSGSPDKIWKIDHLRTIHAMFGLNWLTGLGGQLSKLCPVTQTSIQDGRHQRT